MDSGREDFANNIEVLKAALVGERGERIIEAARAARAEAELAVARAKASDDQALIAHQQLRIEKLTRQLYGPRSERTSRILDQIEFAIRGAGEFGHRGRDRRRDGRRQDHDSSGVHSQAPCTQALARASAA